MTMMQQIVYDAQGRPWFSDPYTGAMKQVTSNTGRDNSGAYNNQGLDAYPGGMQAYYAELEEKYNLPKGWGAQTAFIESSGDPKRGTGSYQGLFALGPKEAAKFGITDRYDPFQSADAGAQYAAENLLKLGPNNQTSFDAYMAHNQGPTGYRGLLDLDPNTRIADAGARTKNMMSQKLAGLTTNDTVGEFLNRMRQKFETGPTGEPWGDDWTTATAENYGGFGGQGGYEQGTDNGLGWIYNSVNRLMPSANNNRGFEAGPQLASMDATETWLRENDPGNADLRPGGKYDRSDPLTAEEEQLRLNSPTDASLLRGGKYFREEGVDANGRQIWNGLVQDDNGNWVTPGAAGALRSGAVDINGRPVWEGYVLADDGSTWITPGTGGAMDTGTFDTHGREVWNGYVKGDDGAWYLPSTAGAYQEGAVDSDGRTIYKGYVQADDGSWVRPGTAGVLQIKGGSNTGTGLIYDPATGTYVENTSGVRPSYAPGAVDANGREIFGGYVQNDNGVWVDPGTAGPRAQTPISTAPSTSDLNGFNTPLEPWQQTQWTPPPVPDVSTNPAAAASTIPGAVQSVNPDWQVPSFGNPAYPGGVFGALPLGGSGVSPSTVGPSGIANPYGNDPNNNGGYGLGGGGSGPITITVNPSSLYY